MPLIDWPAALPQTDDALRLRRKMRELRQTRLRGAGRETREQRSERKATNAVRGAAKKLTARDALFVEQEIVEHGRGLNKTRAANGRVKERRVPSRCTKTLREAPISPGA